MTNFAELRARMVERQSAGRGIHDEPLLDALRDVPRELFVHPDNARSAYGDHSLPIGFGQTISQPHIVALMIEAAGIRTQDRVLEVGAGSGFAAAVLSQLSSHVIAVERRTELAISARDRLSNLEYANVEVIEGDGSCGWPSHAPFDGVLVAASGSHIPKALIDQLAPGGRLVMPVGGQAWAQSLIRLTKLADGRTRQEKLGEVRFVPLIGEQAWRG